MKNTSTNTSEFQKLEKNQRIHAVLMTICWTIGVISNIGVLIGAGLAIFSNMSWWWPIGFGIGAIIFIGAAKEYRKQVIEIGTKLRTLEQQNQ